MPKSSTSEIPSHFKGWAKPGVIPPGLVSDLPPEPGETLDAISGHFRLFQLGDGHRFSTDDILTAWYGTTWCPSAQKALDLGSGVGTVGMIVAWRLPGVRVVTIEAQEDSVALAKKSARYNGVTERFDVRTGDFRAPGLLHDHERFDLITGSPPYFPLGTGVESDHPQKLACRFELRGTVVDYCQIAGRHLSSGGFFACVFPFAPAELARVVSGARAAGLAIVRQRPVIFREGDRPLIALLGMMRASDLPERFREQTWTEPPLVIRDQQGAIHPEYSAVKLAIGFPP
ncbi:MAG TPA: methyltransferase [Verrucomicrobiota bacterium]|nr:SAM-dependent methyltransferase [Verrucomicrobiales bacterium]HRI14769.1 methyltransferase [Verrucomicrobiota bacterium]